MSGYKLTITRNDREMSPDNWQLGFCCIVLIFGNRFLADRADVSINSSNVVTTFSWFKNCKLK